MYAVATLSRSLRGELGFGTRSFSTSIVRSDGAEVQPKAPVSFQLPGNSLS